jgi:two-component system CheB/CheR fusion protein
MGSSKMRRKDPQNEWGGVNGAAAITEPVPQASDLQQSLDFPVVGIGASAGGLGAFEAFLSAVPKDAATGMAFVLVQHLAPDHKSLLTELVKRYTQMQVFEVEDGMVVKPDCVYIIPPNRDMAFLHGRLQLLDPVMPRGQRLAIDYFFRSLAQDQRERAIGIVLSGTGSDGTLGLRAIKGEGGMTMAQELASAEYDGMPHSAIESGVVDFVLPPAEMPAKLMAYVAQAFGKAPRSAAPPSEKIDSALKRIFVLLRSQTGHDFSHYKQNTILRRVERRMAVQHVELWEEYVRYLQQNPKEVEALFRDLLIGVTCFFRDQEAFAALQEKVIPQIFEGKSSGDLVRVWVPGCSTGEEAYSIAILLQEHMETLKHSFRIQVFATDLDGHAIQQARTGLFPSNIAADLSPERLMRFFVQEPDGGSYRIHKAIRDMLIFSEQNVVRDPPFSRLDLVSCRNLLIYLGGELQKKLIPMFHYALNPGGTLFLGSSETVGEFVDLFATVERKWKIYQRKPGLHAPLRPIVGKIHPAPGEAGDPPRRRDRQAETKIQLQELVDRELLNSYAPAAVLINERGEILYVHGRTGHFLEPAQGEVSLNILQMSREGLRRELTTAIHRVAVHKEPVRCEDLRVKTNGSFSTVSLNVRPVSAGMTEGLILVAFEESLISEPSQFVAPPAEGGVATPSDAEMRITALKQELKAKDEYLQSTLEEMQTSNEELKSINEEMQSGNEELQSTNEELETSREELQSVNEELATVNAELQQRLDELSRTNNDMNNLLAGTGVGTIFVDHDLRILRFTPTVTHVINLIQGDIGRPLGHIASNLVNYHRLVEDVQDVLTHLIPREAEVQIKAGTWYLLRIRPYRTLENVIEGAVIIFVDISEQKRMQESLRDAEALHRLAVVVRDASDAITVQDFAGKILAWNPGAERLYGWKESEALAMNIRDVIPADLQEESLAAVKRLSQSEVMEPFLTQRITRSGRAITIRLTATTLLDTTGKPYAVATTERECSNA